MKRFIISVSVAALACGPASARGDYQWLGHKHGCVVSETAGYTHNLSTAFNWDNPPRTFFIDLLGCADYIKRPDANWVAVDDCRNNPLSINEHYKLTTEKLRAFPEAWDLYYSRNLEAGVPARGRGTDGAVLYFHNDGTLAYSASDNDGTKPLGAWYLLTASCTVLN